MQAAEIRDVVERTAALVRHHYVFPEIGNQVADRLATHLAAGQYDEVPGQAELAARVTADLQSGNGDLHLRLLHHLDEVTDETDHAAEEAAEQARVSLAASGMARTERLPGNVGLLAIQPMLFHPALAGAGLDAAMRLLAATDALLIDLRHCRGGSPDMVALLCSYLFDGEPVHLNDLVTPADGSRRQYWTSAYLPGPKYGGTKPIWVLTSATTFSGGEELAYNLQQLGRAVLVGERTRGGAHPRMGVKVHSHLEVTVPVQRAINPVTGTNWEGVGVAPDLDVPAADAFEEAYSRALEHVLTLPAGLLRRAVEDEAREALASLRQPLRTA